MGGVGAPCGRFWRASSGTTLELQARPEFFRWQLSREDASHIGAWLHVLAFCGQLPKAGGLRAGCPRTHTLLSRHAQASEFASVADAHGALAFARAVRISIVLQAQALHANELQRLAHSSHQEARLGT